ncbi:MAG: hypothetical protein ACRDSS_14360, partial [Actinocrinis sp.]
LSAAAGTGVLDVQATASGKTTTAATDSSGPTTAAVGADNELAVGFYADSGFGDTLTAGTGFTQRVNVSSAPDMELLTEDQLATHGTTPSATIGSGSPAVWLAALLVFKHA